MTSLSSDFELYSTIRPSVVPLNHLKEAITGQRRMGTLIIEVTKFKSDLKCVLRRHLEVAMASETTKMATRGNLHMDTRVIEVTEFNSQVSLDLRGHLEATRASEAMKGAFRSNMHMDSRVIEVAGFKTEAIFIALSLATLKGHCPLVLE